MDDSKINNATGLPGALLTEAQAEQAQQNSPGKNENIDQQEFLTLLVNQLQNQDPLNPLSSEEFAVQLAQFTQVEQLISINEKIDGLAPQGGAAGNSVSSMASFLGHEVVVRGQDLSIQSGTGPNLLIDIPTGTQSARVDLLGNDGSTVATISLDDKEAGRHVVPLENMDVEDGEYAVRVVSVTEDGAFSELEHRVTGTVEGFIVEPEPALIVNGKEITLEDITEVHQGGKE